MRTRAVPALLAPLGSSDGPRLVWASVAAHPGGLVMSGLVEVTDIWMMPKMLMNLRDRAEGRGAQVRATKAAGHLPDDPGGLA